MIYKKYLYTRARACEGGNPYLDPHLGPCLDPLLGMPFSLYTGDNGYPDGVPNGTPDGTHDQMTSWSNCMSGSSLRNDPKQQHFTSFTC